MLEAIITGTVENTDLGSMTIRRVGDDLVGSVTYRVVIDGTPTQRTAEWALTAQQKTTLLADFVPSAKQAVQDHLNT